MIGAPLRAEDRPPGARSLAITAGLLLLLVAQTYVHNHWFAADARTPFWDQYRYFEMALKADERLETFDLWNALDLHPSHPPLYALLTALWTKVVPPLDFETARRFNLVLAALTSLATFTFLRQRFAPPMALGLTGLAALFPLHFAFLHLFYIENLLTLTVVLTAVCATKAKAWTQPAWTILTGILIGLGCLTKWTFPVFVGIPLLAATLPKPSWRGLVLLAATSFSIAGPWYISHFDGILVFLGGGVTGGEGLLSGQSGLDAWTYYPREFIGSGLGLPAAILAGLGALVLLLRRRDLKTLAQIAIPTLVFSLILTKKARHLLPLLPWCALLIGIGLTALPRRVGIIVGLALAAHLGLANAHASFGWPTGRARVELGPVRLPLLSTALSPGAPDPRRWPFEEMLASIEAGQPSPRPPQGLIAFNLPEFSEVGFRYEAWRTKRAPFVALVAHALPDGSEFPFGRHYDAKIDEWTPGLIDADFLLVKSGQIWVRYEGPRARRAHAYGALICEAAFDPGGPLAQAYRVHSEHTLPDGSIARVLLRVADDAAAMAQLALQAEPDHAAALAALGAESLLGPDRDALLVAKGVFPAAWRDAEERHAARDRAGAIGLLTSAYAAEGPREEILRQLVAYGAGEPYEALLARWEAARTERESAMHLAALARSSQALGLPHHAVRWLRRAAEAGLARDALLAEARALLETAGAPLSLAEEQDLLGALRARDAR